MSHYFEAYKKYKNRYLNIKNSQNGGEVFINKKGKRVLEVQSTNTEPNSFVNLEVLVPKSNRTANFRDEGSPVALEGDLTFRFSNNFFWNHKARDKAIEILKEIDKSHPKTYILCIGYCKCEGQSVCDKEGKFSKFEDFQIGVSGSIKAEEDGEHGGESFDILRKGKEAMKREICEETGIYVDIKNIETLGGIVMPTRKNMNGLWQIGKVDISDLRKCNFRKNSSEDLVDHKVDFVFICSANV